MIYYRKYMSVYTERKNGPITREISIIDYLDNQA